MTAEPGLPRATVMALLAAAWASAGLAPALGALAGAGAPVDFVRDYVTAHARVHQGRGAAPVDEAGNAYAAGIGAPRVVLLEGPYHLHPPPALLPMLPLVPLGFSGAALAWLALSLVALAGLAFVLAEAATRTAPPPPAYVAGVYGLLVLWPPVLHNLAKGQWSILLAALIGAGFWSLARERPRTAGVWLGLAASLKATPLLLLVFLALRHRRAAWAMVATLTAIGLTSLAASGIEPWRAWFADAPRDVAAWQTWTSNTASVGGLIARVVGGGAFASPLLGGPGLARVLVMATSVALVAWVAIVTLRTPPAPTPEGDRRLFAGWVILAVVLNPLGWTHTVVFALVPLALLVGLVPSAVLAIVLAALTVPRETLAALAGPVPVSPARGLFLSLHAAALLCLAAIALRRPRRSAFLSPLAKNAADARR